VNLAVEPLSCSLTGRNHEQAERAVAEERETSSPTALFFMNQDRPELIVPSTIIYYLLPPFILPVQYII